MSRSRGPALCAAALVLGGCDRAVDYLDFERMADQDKIEPYEPSVTFPDGRGMQWPPQGTVPRERIVGRPDFTLGVGEGGDLEQVPLQVDRFLLERGRDRFERFCGACHGVLGYGNPAIVENAVLRPPPSLHEKRIKEQPPGRIFRTISEGYGLMPSYAAQLPPIDRWAVVAYLPVLWTSQSSDLEALPAGFREEGLVALESQEGSP